MICVDCGSDVPGLIGGSCPPCFTRLTPLLEVPEVVAIVVCAHCGARQTGAHWAQPDAGVPAAWVREDAVREALRLHTRVEQPDISLSETQQDDRTYVVQAALHGEVQGVEVSEERSLTVRQRNGVCDRCSRLAGGYYAAIIQFRATDRPVTKHELDLAHSLVAAELDRMQDQGNRLAFLTKSGPEHGGHDYYIGDIEAARQVARVIHARMGSTVAESAKLVGRRNGEDMFRVTFLVRLQLFSPGDFATLDGRPVRVVSAQRGRAAVMNLVTFRRDKVDLKLLRRLGGPEILEEAVVIMEDGAGLQVLDPQSLRTAVVLRPEDSGGPAETVQVLRFEEQLFWTAPA